MRARGLSEATAFMGPNCWPQSIPPPNSLICRYPIKVIPPSVTALCRRCKPIIRAEGVLPESKLLKTPVVSMGRFNTQLRPTGIEDKSQQRWIGLDQAGALRWLALAESVQ
jgi:hypothetical protein